MTKLHLQGVNVCDRREIRVGGLSCLIHNPSQYFFSSYTSVLIVAGLLANNMPLTLNITIRLLLTAAPF